MACESEYQRAWRAANAETLRASWRKWRLNNPEKAREARLTWRGANRERARELQRRFREKNPDKLCAQQRARYWRLKRSTPKWVSKAALAALYERARLLTSVTGIRHEVDHIVPLAGASVSGLTVPWNLRVVPAIVNARKGVTICEEEVA